MERSLPRRLRLDDSQALGSTTAGRSFTIAQAMPAVAATNMATNPIATKDRLDMRPQRVERSPRQPTPQLNPLQFPSSLTLDFLQQIQPTVEEGILREIGFTHHLMP